MRAAIWWLLPSDGIFRRTSNSLQYFLTRQGRRVVLRGGDVAASIGSMTPLPLPQEITAT